MKKLTFDKLILWVIAGFFIFLPFERLLTLEFFGLTLKIAFIFLLLIISFFLFGRREPKLDSGEKLILLFSLYAYLTTFWSIDSLRSLIISTIFFLTFIGFIALRRLLNSERIEVAKTIIIYLGFALSVFAFWQYFADLASLPYSFLRPEYTKIVFGFPRVQATFLEPLYFANFLLLPLFFTLERLLEKTKGVWFLVSNLVLISAVVTLTLSRGAYIGLGFALVLFSIILLRKFKQFSKRYWLSMASVVFGIFLAVGMIYFSASRQNFDLFVAHAGVADATTGESTLDRWYFAGVAIDQFIKHPFGIGAGAFGALPEFSAILSNGAYQTVGNLYLEILVEEGIVGIGVFLAFLFLFFRQLWYGVKSGKFSNLIYLSIGVAIFIQALSFSSLYILPIWAFLALAWGKSEESRD